MSFLVNPLADRQKNEVVNGYMPFVSVDVRDLKQAEANSVKTDLRPFQASNNPRLPVLLV